MLRLISQPMYELRRFFVRSPVEGSGFLRPCAGQTTGDAVAVDTRATAPEEVRTVGACDAA